MIVRRGRAAACRCRRALAAGSAARRDLATERPRGRHDRAPRPRGRGSLQTVTGIVAAPLVAVEGAAGGARAPCLVAISSTRRSVGRGTAHARSRGSAPAPHPFRIKKHGQCRKGCTSTLSWSRLLVGYFSCRIRHGASMWAAAARASALRQEPTPTRRPTSCAAPLTANTQCSRGR